MPSVPTSTARIFDSYLIKHFEESLNYNSIKSLYNYFQFKSLQEAPFYGLVSKEAMQSPLNTKKVVELPFTKGCYYVAYCGGTGTFESLVVDYYQSRPNELIQGHVVNVLDLMVK